MDTNPESPEPEDKPLAKRHVSTPEPLAWEAIREIISGLQEQLEDCRGLAETESTAAFISSIGQTARRFAHLSEYAGLTVPSRPMVLPQSYWAYWDQKFLDAANAALKRNQM